MAGQKTISVTYREPPVIFQPTVLHITGDGNPVPNGEYVDNGISGGRPRAVRRDGVFYLFYDEDAGFWKLRPTLDHDSNDFFYSDPDYRFGLYNHHGSYTGTPNVIEGP